MFRNPLIANNFYWIWFIFKHPCSWLLFSFELMRIDSCFFSSKAPLYSSFFQYWNDIQYFMYASGTNSWGCSFLQYYMILLSCIISVLHSRHVLWDKKPFPNTLTFFGADRITAKIKLVVPAFQSGKGWGFIAKNGSNWIDVDLMKIFTKTSLMHNFQNSMQCILILFDILLMIL